MNLDGTRLQTSPLGVDPLTLAAVPPAPCTAACPAGINVKAYVSLIAEGRFGRALEVVREHCPLPGICGRICHHPCEAVCIRGDFDDPVAIRALKRFIADVELDVAQPPPPALPARRERVAVIGAGPAGLTAAHDLARAGFPVTVLESEPEPGGMLRYGIAEYRLPHEVLDHEIEILCRNAIEIHTNCRIGRDMALDELLERGYSAVLLAVGAQLGRGLDLGEPESPAIEDALGFLRRVRRGGRERLSGRVVVIGGGSTAVEAARTALRLGAESAEIVYRRHWREMPASAEEVEEARGEGVALRYLRAPRRAVYEEGRLRGLECLEVALGEPDASGRRRPIPIPGTGSVLGADRVLLAVGQEADLGFLPEEIRQRVAAGHRLSIDAASSMTGLYGVFAAGDVVTGPATVIDAIAAGHRAAAAIDRFLSTGTTDSPVSSGPGTRSPEYGLPDAPPRPAQRLRPALELPVEGREFAETELAYSPECAVAEAGRCLRCGPCSECRVCASSCGRRHVWLRLAGTEEEPGATHLIRAPSSTALALESGASASGRLLDTYWSRDLELFPARVRVVEELCRGCGRCAEVCGFEAISRLDPDDPESKVGIHEALCRGCNLCLAVCPTDALVPDLPAARPREILPPGEQADGGPTVLVACRQRAAELEPDLGRTGMVPLWLRCIGEADAGMLVDLRARGAPRVIVAGCAGETCRYSRGTEMAATQVARARTILRLLGIDESSIVSQGPARSEWLDADPASLADSRPAAAAEGGMT